MAEAFYRCFNPKRPFVAMSRKTAAAPRGRTTAIAAATPSVMSGLTTAHAGKVKFKDVERRYQHAGGPEFARGSPIRSDEV
jgi:hypothetical protein